jgi:hypothetical protein
MSPFTLDMFKRKKSKEEEEKGDVSSLGRISLTEFKIFPKKKDNVSSSDGIKKPADIDPFCSDEIKKLSEDAEFMKMTNCWLDRVAGFFSFSDKGKSDQDFNELVASLQTVQSQATKIEEKLLEHQAIGDFAMKGLKAALQASLRLLVPGLPVVPFVAMFGAIYTYGVQVRS